MDDKGNHQKFNYSYKKTLIKKISQIKNKKKYIKLFNIIDKDFKNYTINNNGIFINLNSLQESTLINIDDFLNKLKKKNNKDMLKIENDITDLTYDIDSSSSEEFNIKEIILTNIEKDLIKGN